MFVLQVVGLILGPEIRIVFSDLNFEEARGLGLTVILLDYIVLDFGDSVA